METKKAYNFKKEKLADDQVKLIIQVASESYLGEKQHVYKELAKDVVIQGFRPGTAPKLMIEARLGNRLYEELFNHLLPEVTWEILQSEKLNPLNQVQYQVTKFSDNDGLEFTAVFSEFPQFSLRDLHKIKVRKSEAVLTDKELEAEINNVMKVYSKNMQSEKEAGKVSQINKTDLSQPSDEVIKTWKLGVNNFTELRNLVKNQLLARKKQVEEEKWLSAVIKEAVTLSKISAPKILIAEELARKQADYKKQITELGLKFEDFLATQKTGLADLKKKWQEEIEARLAQELLYVEIARVNKINITNEEIQQELAAISDPKLKERMETAEGKRYIATIKLQQKALMWLKQEVEKNT